MLVHEVLSVLMHKSVCLSVCLFVFCAQHTEHFMPMMIRTKKDKKDKRKRPGAAMAGLIGSANPRLMVFRPEQSGGRSMSMSVPHVRRTRQPLLKQSRRRGREGVRTCLHLLRGVSWSLVVGVWWCMLVIGGGSVVVDVSQMRLQTKHIGISAKYNHVNVQCDQCL